MDSSSLEQPNERVLQAGHSVPPACDYHKISAKRTDLSSALTATVATKSAAVENASGAVDAVRSDANTKAQTPVPSSTPLQGTGAQPIAALINSSDSMIPREGEGERPRPRAHQTAVTNQFKTSVETVILKKRKRDAKKMIELDPEAHKKLMKYANEKHGGVYESVIEEMLTMAATRARDVRDAAKAKRNAEKLEKQRAKQLEKAAKEKARAAKTQEKKQSKISKEKLKHPDKLPKHPGVTKWKRIKIEDLKLGDAAYLQAALRLLLNETRTDAENKSLQVSPDANRVVDTIGMAPSGSTGTQAVAVLRPPSISLAIPSPRSDVWERTPSDPPPSTSSQPLPDALWEHAPSGTPASTSLDELGGSGELWGRAGSMTAAPVPATLPLEDTLWGRPRSSAVHDDIAMPNAERAGKKAAGEAGVRLGVGDHSGTGPSDTGGSGPQLPPHLASGSGLSDLALESNTSQEDPLHVEGGTPQYPISTPVALLGQVEASGADGGLQWAQGQPTSMGYSSSMDQGSKLPGIDLQDQTIHPLQAYLTQQPLEPSLEQPGQHLPSSSGMSTVDASSPLLRAIQVGGVAGKKAPPSYNEESNTPPSAPQQFSFPDDLPRSENPVSEHLLEVTGSNDAGTSRMPSSSSSVPPPVPLPPGEVVDMAALLTTPWQQLTVSQLRQLLEQVKLRLKERDRALQASRGVSVRRASSGGVDGGGEGKMRKIHTCDQCGKVFALPNLLRDHINMHTGARPYICSKPGCNEAFACRQEYRRHVGKHELAWMCPYAGCGKRFAAKEHMQRHQLTHTEDRPVPCQWEGCNKRFKDENSLKGHMRVHTGEKKFRCHVQGCGKAFGYRIDLNRHTRTHFGQPARGSNGASQEAPPPPPPPPPPIDGPPLPGHPGMILSHLTDS